MLALLAGCLVVTSVRAAAAHVVAQPVEHKAGLVVQFAEGNYTARCISFREDSISGLEVLNRSGLQVKAWGGAICRIEAYGCDYPREPCFCQCQGTPCAYWSYWHWRDGRWVYSPVGAASHTVRDGDVEGWAWGDGQPPSVGPTGEPCLPDGSMATVASLHSAVGNPITPVAVAQPMGSASAQPALPTAAGGQRAPLGQYAAFGVAALLMTGGLLAVRRRHGG
jgi:hypothetical protein